MDVELRLDLFMQTAARLIFLFVEGGATYY